jgi:thiamine-phosphate pyrophosphorylase
MTAGHAGAAAPRPLEHCVTDRRRFDLSLDVLVDRAARAARAGADVIQVRERDLSDRDLIGLVRLIVTASGGTGARVLVNDRADVAVAAGAAGVHLRSDSPRASRVRAFVPPAFVIGRSVHSLAEVDETIEDGGANYLLFGTVFPSSGKPAGHPVAGLAALHAVCARSPLPVIAIGGIDRSRVPAVVEAGAAGFAAVELFMRLTPLPQVV